MTEVLLDALKDSAIIFPFIFLIYLLMEAIEGFTKKEKVEALLKGNFAPIVSAGLGVVPECGFSVMCAKLFDNGLIKIGTLLAAFIATSDEGLIILISSGTPAWTVIKLILCKIVFAIAIGVLFNFTLNKLNVEHVCPKNGDCTECGEHHDKWYDKYLLHPLLHTLKVFVFVLVVNFVIGTLIFFVGEDKILAFTETKKGLQPLVTGLVGLIPNCSSSIILARGFAEGLISFPALVSGLSTNAGVGLTILFGKGKNVYLALLITLMLFALGVALGYLAFLINI